MWHTPADKHFADRGTRSFRYRMYSGPVRIQQQESKKKKDDRRKRIQYLGINWILYLIPVFTGKESMIFPLYLFTSFLPSVISRCPDPLALESIVRKGTLVFPHTFVPEDSTITFDNSIEGRENENVASWTTRFLLLVWQGIHYLIDKKANWK